MKTFVSQFKIINVSSNTNSFGLYGVIMADKTGLAFEIAVGSLYKPEPNEILHVTLNEKQNIVSIPGISYEIPRKLSTVPADALKELFSESKQ